MLTKTRIGNYLRRHMLGDQPTFRQGFKEGVAFAEKHAKREWQGLTHEDKKRVLDSDFGGNRADCMDAAEGILREKNA